MTTVPHTSLRLPSALPSVAPAQVVCALLPGFDAYDLDAAPSLRTANLDALRSHPLAAQHRLVRGLPVVALEATSAQREGGSGDKGRRADRQRGRAQRRGRDAGHDPPACEDGAMCRDFVPRRARCPCAAAVRICSNTVLHT